MEREGLCVCLCVHACVRAYMYTMYVYLGLLGATLESPGDFGGSTGTRTLLMSLLTKIWKRCHQWISLISIIFLGFSAGFPAKNWQGTPTVCVSRQTQEIRRVQQKKSYATINFLVLNFCVVATVHPGQNLPHRAYYDNLWENSKIFRNMFILSSTLPPSVTREPVNLVMANPSYHIWNTADLNNWPFKGLFLCFCWLT